MAGENLDTLGAGAKGYYTGMAKGAAAGAPLAAATGGLSVLVGAGLGSTFGGVSSALKQNKANKSQEIPMVDPLERQRLAELEQQRKALLAGTDAITQGAIGDVKNIGRATQNAIVKNTGGDVSSTMDALLRAQKGTQAGVNQSVMEGKQRLPYFDSAAGNLNSRIAQRRLELQLLKRSQATAENAQSITDNNVSANALLATQNGVMTPEQMAELLKRRQQQESIGGTSAIPVTPNEVNTEGMTNVMGDLSSSFQNMPTLNSGLNL